MKASKHLKRLHRKAVRGNLDVSFKQFVRELASSGSEDDKVAADSWRLNKGPTQRRLDKEDRKKRKGAIIEVQRQATRTAKRKRSGGGKG